MNILFTIIIEYKQALFSWLLVTWKLCLYTWVIGIILGVLYGVVSSKFKRVVWTFLLWATSVLWWVPVLVLLFWMYFPMQQYLHISINPFWLAVSCFVLVNSLLVWKIVFHSIESLPKKYVIAAKLAWMSKKNIVSKIQLPLIFNNVIGPIIMIQIAMLHNSIFASLINVNDIFRQIQRINAIVYKPIELYSLLAVIFLIVSIPLYYIAKKMTQKYPAYT